MTENARPPLTPQHLALARDMTAYATNPWLSPVESEAFGASAELMLAYLRGDQDLTDKPHAQTLIELCAGRPFKVSPHVRDDASPSSY